MNLDTVLAALGSNAAARGENPIPQADKWETSARTLPPEGLFFLEQDVWVITSDYPVGRCNEPPDKNR